MKETTEILVTKAIEGNQPALETLIHSVQDMVYNLSLKMLLFPEDAKDATQEILIRIVTRLSTYRCESQFKTWVYRIATNYLLNVKGKKSRVFAMPFEEYAQLIDQGQSNLVTYTQNEGELSLLEEEVKISCTQGLLLCLNEMSRMVYVLGEILEFNSKEGSEILEITPENFRKQLSRSRTKIRNFLQAKCGLVNTNNPCRCNKKIDYLIQRQLIEPTSLRYAPYSIRSIDLVEKIADLESTIAIYRLVPGFKTPKEISNQLKKALKS